MKRIILSSCIFILILACIAGYLLKQEAIPTTKGEILNEYNKLPNKNDDATSEFVDSILNKQYRKYFKYHKLFCCDYGIDEGIFFATVYTGDERYEFSVNFNTKTGEIKTTASQAFHAKAIRNSVEKIIRDKTTLKDYSIAIDSKSSEEFKDDFNSFVTDKATTIDVTFFFDNEISDYDARNMIDFMKAMRNKEFNGHLDYLVDDYFSETFDYRKNYTVEDKKT